jgi:hypothetical protein
MQLVLNIPDDFIDPVKDKLTADPIGVLEAVALDAVLGFLTRLAGEAKPSSALRCL